MGCGGCTMRDRAYSFARALAFLANPTDPAVRDASDVERAISETLGESHGAGRGLIVPATALVRSMNTGTEAAGGALVGQVSASFEGALRAQLVTAQAGATVLTGLKGDASIPTMLSGAVAQWLRETEVGETDVSDTVPEVARGALVPRTVAACIPVSRRLMLQGQPAVADLIASDLLAALAHEIDAAALGASAQTAAPAGLRQSLATSKIGFAGGVPTWTELLDMEQDVLDANAVEPAFILAPVMARALKEAEASPGSGRHILANGKIADRPAFVSSAWPATEVVLGGFADLVIALWGGIDLRLDVATGAASDTRYLRAFVDVAFLTRRKTSFAYGGAS
jgi:HK97 family phage major capsid protein